MIKDKIARWNMWYSKSQNQGCFLKAGDRREKQLPEDARVIKHFYSDSYNKVWPRCYDWLQLQIDSPPYQHSAK